MDLSKHEMYRFPWSMNDNPIGWLEITDKCNTVCRGCYRLNMTGHKPLEQIKEEVRLLKAWRNCDNISIAGGEPLIHPDIIEIVDYIRQQGMKPLILTNGIALKDNIQLLRDLKKAGALGFTFHIDSEQSRPHWKGKSELELCELRLEYARMVAEVGGLFVSFGLTVYPSNIHVVPEIVKWANQHVELVHGLVFITFRNATMDGTFNYFVNGQQLAQPAVSYTAPDSHEAHIQSTDVRDVIHENYPHYAPSAYMGGSQSPDKVTWLVGVQVGSRDKMYGSIGAKTMELVQMFYHLVRGKYLVYTPGNRLPKIAFLLSMFDGSVGKIHGAYWKDILSHPSQFFAPIYTQSIGIIQGPDILEDGRADMCESCPDMTIWDGKLVHSCRMDEWRLYGTYATAQRRVSSPEQVLTPDEIPVVAK
ncbi:MAG: radical SAM protein [Anaerolineae bacterium]